MTFFDSLEQRITTVGNPICMGMDPVLSKIPFEGSSPEETIKTFYMTLLEAMDAQNIYPAAVKPNSAYYEAISVSAMQVLYDLIEAYSERGIHICLDAKRGDIGKSSAAYAKAAFDVYKADSVTVSPYMGEDSVKPFSEYAEGKGVYMLLRTSNKGAQDIQDILTTDETQLFYSVGKKLLSWNENNAIGAVVGATNTQEMENITRFFVEAGKEIPFLIPGISVSGVPGQQGGDIQSTLTALKNGGSTHNFHLLNSSSGLNYAYQAFTDLSYDQAFIKALQQLVADCTL
ncbi:MAG: orotidine-5'-phosphate decarboxylase [Fibrobacterales bacterium]